MLPASLPLLLFPGCHHQAIINSQTALLRGWWIERYCAPKMCQIKHHQILLKLRVAKGFSPSECLVYDFRASNQCAVLVVNQ